MAIAINGAGTITGLSAGGLPDDSIITADIANSAVTDGKIAGMASSKLTGTLPAISGAALTNLPVPADNSITLAKMAGGTDGQIITYDASGDPVAIGPGTAGQVLTSAGANLPQTFADAAAGGKLLQVVSVTNNTYTSTQSTSWVTSNLTASITPAATSSKILIIANLTLYFDRTGETPGMTLFRGTVSGTNLGDASHGFAFHDIGSPVGSGTRTGSLGLNYLDSPSTSSAQVYTIGVQVSNSNSTLIKGSNGEKATMTLMEIGA